MEYLLGTSDTELDRLAFQHEVWRPVTDAFLDRLAIAPGSRVLDAGSGPGFVALDLARRVGPGGRVVAVDASPRWEQHLREVALARGLPVIEARHADLEVAELEPETYDFVFCRWVLSFVRDPRALVRRFTAALRPGGVLAIEDYNHEGISIFPRSQGFEAVVRATRAWYRQGGGDTWVAGRLPANVRAAGLEQVHFAANVLAGGPSSQVFRWADLFFPVFAPRWVEEGLLEKEDMHRFLAEWEERKRDPDSLFFSPIVVDLAARKPGGRTEVATPSPAP